MRTMLLLVAVGTMLYADKGEREKTDERMSPMGRLAKNKIAQLTGGLSVRTGSCLNQPDCQDEEITAGSLQAETTIAVDRTGQHVVVGFNDFRGFTSGSVSVSGYMYSDDGGATFVDGGQLPTGPTTILFGQPFPQIFGDPDVKYLGGCNFVYSSIMVKRYGAQGLVETLSVHRSTDCGHTWSGPFEVAPASNPHGFIDIDGFAVDSADKELGDVDPDTNRYGLCWTNFTPAAPGFVEISCTYSDNILAPNPVFAARRIVGSTIADGQGVSMGFAGGGSHNAYAAWSRFPGSLQGYGNNIGFARSTDNGATWSPAVNLASDFVTMDLAPGNDRVNNFPSLAVDRSPGAHRGNIYVVYAANNFLDGADVVVQRSTNGGLTFSAPTLLNSRPGRDRAQWFPYVTVDRSTGRAWVFYYDQGVATSGDLTEISYLYSDDGGFTWSPPAPLTARPFKAGWGNDTSQPNLGDYNQAVAQAGTFYAAFASTRQVGFTDGQPTTQMTTPDVNFAKVASSTVKAPLETGRVTFEESGGNGNIDPGDRVRLVIELANAVTNPANDVTVRGILAVLSTSTPGVSVTQAFSPYPNLEPGEREENRNEFTLQVGSSFVPGTPIELHLDIRSSAQGSAALDVTLRTGTPVYTTLLSENFDGVAAGALPGGWTAAHGAGANTVRWTTTPAFAPTLCGSSNKAFHINALDGPAGGAQGRWERLFSPTFLVPANAQRVVVDFDVCYDTENDPVLPGVGYDGFFLRITDVTPGRTLRSVLAEAFETRFTTGSLEHYPKHLPRNDDPNYFEDMSAWAGFSNGPQHVHMEFPGMAGSSAQLRFEYAQDQFATCADVRPGHACGVTVDNVLVRSAVSVVPNRDR